MSEEAEPGASLDANGKALMGFVVDKLVEAGYMPERDPAMGEYIVVMLTNQKSADQITTELTDLIGPEYTSDFTDWLFQTQSEVQSGTAYADQAASAGTSATAVDETADEENAGEEPVEETAAAESVRGIETVQDSRANGFGGRGGPRGRGGRGRGRGGVFGNAIGDLNQPRQNLKREAPGDSTAPPDSRRPRVDGPPRGPRADGGLPTGPSGEKRNIFERAGVAERGGRGRRQNGGGFGQRGGGGGFGNQAPAMNPHAQPFGQPPFQPGFPSNRGGPPHQQFAPNPYAPFPGQYQQFYQPQPMAYAPAPQQGRPQQPIPTVPQDGDLCKYGVDCTNASCRFSHPSPVATKESGLVLSKEHCEKGIKCDDPDCSKSHVSRAAKNAPRTQPQSYAPPHQPQPIIVYAAPPTSAIPGAGTKPCKFGKDCHRADCVFIHPWQLGQGPPPPHVQAQVQAQAHGGGHASKPKKPQSTFAQNQAKMTQESGIGPMPDLDKSAMSERMKRFGGVADGEAERVIPGETTA